MEIRLCDFDDPRVIALDWSGLQSPDISLFALWEGEELLGFGALKELDAKIGEIKSMRTADAHLRKGVASGAAGRVSGGLTTAALVHGVRRSTGR